MQEAINNASRRYILVCVVSLQSTSVVMQYLKRSDVIECGDRLTLLNVGEWSRSARRRDKRFHIAQVLVGCFSILWCCYCSSTLDQEFRHADSHKNKNGTHACKTPKQSRGLAGDSDSRHRRKFAPTSNITKRVGVILITANSGIAVIYRRIWGSGRAADKYATEAI